MAVGYIIREGEAVTTFTKLTQGYCWSDPGAALRGGGGGYLY